MTDTRTLALFAALALSACTPPPICNDSTYRAGKADTAQTCPVYIAPPSFENDHRSQANGSSHHRTERDRDNHGAPTNSSGHQPTKDEKPGHDDGRDNPAHDKGTGNPGNDKSVGKAGETPSGKGGWGSGEKGVSG